TPPTTPVFPPDNTIADAFIPQNGNQIPQETDFAIKVNITDPNFTSVADLDVTVNMVHPRLNQVSMVLQGPGGQRVTLFTNRTFFDGSSDTSTPPIGLPDVAQIGMLPAVPIITLADFFNLRDIGTVFDQQAPRNINDPAAAAPYASHYEPE